MGTKKLYQISSHRSRWLGIAPAIGLLQVLVTGLLTPPVCIAQAVGERLRDDLTGVPDNATFRVAEAYFDLYRSLDVEGLAPYYNDESVLRDTTADPPIEVRGREEIVTYLGELKDKTGQWAMQADGFIFRNDLVVVDGIYRWQLGSDLYFGDVIVVLRLREKIGEDGYFMVEHEQYLDYKKHPRAPFLHTSSVATGYVIWVVALSLMISKGFKEKSYGMPIAGLTPMLALCVITAFVGPWFDPILFFPKGNFYLVAIWALWAIQLAVVFFQYLRYEAKKLERRVSLAVFACSLATIWAFIVFYEDYYVNEITELITLTLAAAYVLYELFWPHRLRAMTPGIAWGLAVGTALIAIPTVLGHPENAFPFKHHGYYFIYWISLLAVFLLFAYAIMVTRRLGAARARGGHEGVRVVEAEKPGANQL